MRLGYSRRRKHPTPVLGALFLSLMAVLLVSLILGNRILLFGGLFFALYLLAIVIRILTAVPGLPLEVPLVVRRVIAGSSADVPLYAVGRASLRLHYLISPVDPWVKAVPSRFTLCRDQMELKVSVTPPLAGSSHPELRLSVIDPWGFIQLNRVIEPVELRVIPRARYAGWLAMKYLEQAGAGATLASQMPPNAVFVPRRGIEYTDSRPYQPGDRLRYTDWKHTLKLSQLITKQYTEVGQPAAIITVNLSVQDAEGGDKLAFDLITTALTVAREGIPTALAAYDHERVAMTTPVSDPREILRQTLSLVKDITPVELAHRQLELPDIGKLRRSITQLESVASAPAERLLALLNFEYRAIGEAARNHWATLALRQVVERTSPPAIIVLVSELNHDAEALLVTTDNLNRRGFTTLSIGAGP